MKIFSNLSRTALPLITLGLASLQAHAETSPPLTTDQQKFGYAVGVDLGKDLARMANHVDLKALEAGMEEAAAGKPLRMDDAARVAIKASVSEQVKAEQIAASGSGGDKTQTDGAAFLSENGKKPGIKTTPSGLQYEVIKEGSGRRPTKDSNVTVNYKGTLLDGSTFDNSYDRGRPATFGLSQVIPGWTEGVQLMTSGSKYRFYVPASLAYGDRGAGAKIGPNQTLIFEVELLNIE